MKNYHKVIVKQIINEIIQETQTPVMKYYAFDWDDNLMFMPTKIYLKDDKGKNIMFKVSKKFKSGGAVEVGKGKDYIKDLI